MLAVDERISYLYQRERLSIDTLSAERKTAILIPTGTPTLTVDLNLRETGHSEMIMLVNNLLIPRPDT
ncbi:MAG: hypothetical protein ACI87E_003562 [Mariniblastus sp.]|jgi:hypothetical protein